MGVNAFFYRLKNELLEGYGIINCAVFEALAKTKSKTVLVAKYTAYTLVLSVVYAIASSFIEYFMYTIFLPLSVLILLFHHELFSIDVKSKMRFAKGAAAITIILFAVFMLFQAGAVQGSSASIISITASSLAIFIFVLFLFMPMYIVKAGATPLKSIKNAFGFISKNAIKSMFYILFLILALSLISSLPSLAGLELISPIIFTYLSYALFIFITAYWERCKGI